MAVVSGARAPNSEVGVLRFRRRRIRETPPQVALLPSYCDTTPSFFCAIQGAIRDAVLPSLTADHLASEALGSCSRAHEETRSHRRAPNDPLRFRWRSSLVGRYPAHPPPGERGCGDGRTFLGGELVLHDCEATRRSLRPDVALRVREDSRRPVTVTRVPTDQQHRSRRPNEADASGHTREHFLHLRLVQMHDRRECESVALRHCGKWGE